VYHIWQTNSFTKNTPTPVWTLAFGGAMIVIGLATYGYKIMAALGNRLTLMSPSRGFSMEMGASITVLLASQYGIPVSTTMW
jgi:sodium-dependent phosphate transporter